MREGKHLRGEKAMEITNREREVVRAWMELQSMGDFRKLKLTIFKFTELVKSTHELGSYPANK